MVAENILKRNMENSLLLSVPKEKIQQFATENVNFDKDYNYFHVMDHTEPHAVRRKIILEKYPEISKLMEKREPLLTLFFVCLINIVQLCICNSISKNDYSWTAILTFVMLIGAVLNHGLYVLYHDITHFNCFKSVLVNQLFAIFCNLPQVIPSAISFGRYHKDHHTYMGHPIDDPDIPTVLEIKLLQTWISRLVFVFIIPLFYGLRPFFKRPKSPTSMEYVNIVVCMTYNIFIYQFFGVKALVYLLACTWFGLSVHPVSAHVIAEHYEFCKSQDTYSYYGWINYINFNVGYHIEHHDFPNIPWHKLPEVRKIAPEFYDTLPQIDSYTTVIFKYIFDGSIGPWSRIALGSEEKKVHNN